MCSELPNIGHNIFSNEGSQAWLVCLSEKCYIKAKSLGLWWNGTDSVVRSTDGTDTVVRGTDGTDGVFRNTDGTDSVVRSTDGTDSVRPKYWERSLLQCHCAHHKFRVDWPVIEVGPRGDRPAPDCLSRRFED